MEQTDTNLMDRLGLLGDGVALQTSDGAVATRAHLGRTVSNSIAWLNAENHQCGGRLLCLLPDCPSTLPFQLASSSTVHTAVINPASSIPEIAQLVRETKATAIVTQSPTQEIETLIEQMDLGHIEVILNHQTHVADFNLELRRRYSGTMDSDIVPSLVLTTSGSSGKPKVVPIENSALLVSAENIIQALELDANDINIHMLPMFHIGALLDSFIVPLISGGTVHLAHPISAENLIRAIKTAEPTWIQAVPTMLKALLRGCDDDELRELGRTVHFIRSVSAGLAPAVQAEIETKMGTRVIQMYGMTETAGQICSNGLKESASKPGSVGRPMGCEVRILDQSGGVVPLGRNGEICVAGPSVFSGYANIDRASTFHGRWFRTGDVGYFDDDNFLYIVGRKGDLINRGGEKLSAVEVEQALMEHPAVAQAAVFSLPHQTLGDDIGAVVALANGVEASESSLREFLSSRLSSYKVPRHILIADALPLLASGKVDKKACRDRFLKNEPLLKNEVPLSEIGTEIAQVWSKVLKQPKPGENDDFFDAGGDSLAAQTFVLDLEERLNVTLPANILFESPTFTELETAVSKLIASSPPIHPEEKVLRAVRAVTAAWPGTRVNERSLIVGLGSVGEKKPFFFCANGLQDYLHLAKKMDPERPFYAMRNLNRLPEKSAENSQKLAEAYAKEMDRIQPDGAFTLGGHCGGVDIARMIAEEMIAKGRDVNHFVVIDSVLRDPCPAPALVIWTKDSDYSHYSGASQFIEADRRADILFPFGARFQFLRENHDGLMEFSAVADIAKLIEAEISVDIEHPEDVAKKLSAAKDELERRKDSYKAEISITGRRFFDPDGHTELLVSIKNTSAQVWDRTINSGILLIAKWKRPSGKMYLDPAGHAELESPIGPGETKTVKMRIKCRNHRSPMRLVVDLVDDGVAWFSWTEDTADEHWMMPRYF